MLINDMKFFRNIFALCFFAVNASSCSHYYKGVSNKAMGQWGRLKSFQDLQRFHEGKDYNVLISDLGDSPLVMAIHAGMIEVGTGELAKEITRDTDFNSYIFEGLKAPDFFTKSIQSGYMHITSHKFNDQRLTGLANKSQFCLSLHGFPSMKTDMCLGGLADNRIKSQLEKQLKSAFPALNICSDCCPPYMGKHPKNVVNLCKDKGIQLEMSPRVRKKILNNIEFKRDLASLLKDFLGSF